MKVDRKSRVVFWATGLITAAFFWLDLWLPLGVAAGVPYITSVLIALWYPKRRFVIDVAVLSSVLTIIGYFWSSTGSTATGSTAWMVLVNRGLALFVIWNTTILGMLWRRSQARIEHERDQLEVTVGRRTAALVRSNQRLQDEITERKKITETLRATEERYLLVQKETNIGLWNWDIKNNQINCSEKCSVLFGLSADHGMFSMKQFVEWVHPEDRERVSSELRDAKFDIKPFNSEYRMVWPDGSVHWLVGKGKVFFEKSEELQGSNEPVRLLGFVFDITERAMAEEKSRRLERELARLGRLNTMGEMATGMAHELNQPLTAIANYCYSGRMSLANSSFPRSEFLSNLFEKLESQALRSGEIIRRLRELVSKKESEHSVMQVSVSIQEVMDLLEADLRFHQIQCELNLHDSLPPLLMNHIQIQQVLMNLIKNAMDAIMDAESSERRIVISTSEAEGDFVKVAVCDTGKGISVDDQENVFEAFFTQKAQGMGMGLAISRSIIESHHGRIWVTNNSDRGVTFHFTLPIAKDENDVDTIGTNGLHLRG